MARHVGKGTGGLYIGGIGASDDVDKITEWLGGGKGEDDSKGVYWIVPIWEFDEDGRVVLVIPLSTCRRAEVGRKGSGREW